MQTSQTFTLLYLTPLVYLRLWFWFTKPKRKETGSLSKSERQKLQRLYTQGAAAYGPVRNLVKASNLSVSKVKQFLHSKPSYTKFNPATRKIKRMKAFARFKVEIWWMDLAYVDKLATYNNGVKYLLVRQNLFDRTVDAKEWKQKIPRKLFVHFWLWIQKRIDPKQFGLTREQNLLEGLKNYAKLKKYKIYSTMCGTKAAFAERTIRCLKNIPYRYMEDNGYKYIHKCSHFVRTLNCKRNCSLDLIPKNVKNSDVLSILYMKSLRELRKPKFKIRERVRIWKYDIPSRKGYKPQFTEEVFEIVAISSRKPPTYTTEDEQDEIIRGKFHQKELTKVN